MSDQDPDPRHATAIDFDDKPEDGWTEPKQKAIPENDPTEYVPVMRHHLHESLWSIQLALGNIQACDLADSYRQGLTVPKESPLARQLERSHATLAAYLGLLDDEENGDGAVIPEGE